MRSYKTQGALVLWNAACGVAMFFVLRLFPYATTEVKATAQDHTKHERCDLAAISLRRRIISKAKSSLTSKVCARKSILTLRSPVGVAQREWVD
jgi:hypothetical protein